jgi:hypothetical protein
VLSLWCVPVLGQEKPAQPEPPKPKKVKLEELPEAARECVKRNSTGAKIGRIERIERDGTIRFEAELKTPNGSKDLLVDQDGTLLEVEEEISLPAVGTTARLAIEKAAEGGKVKKVETVKNGEGKLLYYEVDIEVKGKKSEIKISPDGELLP